jgi:hypothetical protein
MVLARRIWTHVECRLRESELHSQGTLNYARSATYYACGGANCRSCSAADRCGDFAEVAVTLARNGISEVRVVKEIKEVGPEA